MELDNNATLKFSKEQRGISFEKFSSGERKITYLFLEILFNEVDVFLIDEPELSISLNYQNKIVWDLHCLTEGKALFIATHAPFVYEDFKKFPGNTVVEVK
ncbi:hypothetical protein A6K76_06670 [Caryophanon latum]|uniref:ATPase AAA-type core domain-containing protein n=1 Tax=Caryophanon latum TaxID=33977 RepID=A0A1C0YZF3_9BACL|nr:hypothetical protein A6K76_06670 [Caryophanon latum]